MEFRPSLESSQELNEVRENVLRRIANAWNMLPKVSLFGFLY